jgi:hypothetical protein
MVQMYLNNTGQASEIGWPSWNWKVMLIYGRFAQVFCQAGRSRVGLLKDFFAR